MKGSLKGRTTVYSSYILLLIHFITSTFTLTYLFPAAKHGYCNFMGEIFCFIITTFLLLYSCVIPHTNLERGE